LVVCVPNVSSAFPATVLNGADCGLQNRLEISLRCTAMVMTIGVALGIAIGARIGAATHSIEKWIAFGAAIGVLITVVLTRGERKS